MIHFYNDHAQMNLILMKVNPSKWNLIDNIEVFLNEIELSLIWWVHQIWQINCARIRVDEILAEIF